MKPPCGFSRLWHDPSACLSNSDSRLEALFSEDVQFHATEESIVVQGRKPVPSDASTDFHPRKEMLTVVGEAHASGSKVDLLPSISEASSRWHRSPGAGGGSTRYCSRGSDASKPRHLHRPHLHSLPYSPGDSHSKPKLQGAVWP